MNPESKKKRSFFRTIWARLEFLWKIVMAFTVPAIIMIVMYASAIKHSEFMYQVLKLANNTGRLDMTLSVSDAINRVYYYDRSAVTYVSSTVDKTVGYQNGRIYSVATMLDDEMRVFLNSFSSSNSENLKKFFYNDMGATGNTLYAQDPVAKKGYLMTFAEFLWLSKYLLLKYKLGSSRTVVFNTVEYKRMSKRF